MIHPLRVNDWSIKKFLIVVLAIQLALWGVIGLDAIGLQIPLLRNIVGFAYLAFVPGVVILRVLKLHNIGSIETLVYSVGLSLATVMFIGVVVNGVYPSFGISAPISTIPLMISFTVLTLALCAIAYKRDRDLSATTYVDTKGLSSSPVLLLFLLPLLSILGTQLVNVSQNNIILMLLIVLIVLVLILAGFTRYIPERLYPLAVFSIALSLLFYRSLVSQYISGYDIHEEYASAALVQSLGYWDPSGPSLINSLPAINVLPAVVADISGLSLTVLFKAMYPFLFSVACVGLYQVFRSQTTGKVAFFAVLFIVTAGRVYYDIALIPRQLAASLFLVASILLIVERNVPERPRTLFLIIFGFALVLSHYGLAYIYIAILVCGTAAEWLVGNAHSQRLWKGLRTRLGISPANHSDARSEIMRWPANVVNMTFVLLFTTFAFTWYLNTAGGIQVGSFGRRVVEFARLITTDFFHSTAAISGPIGVETEISMTGMLLSYVNQGNSYLKELLIISGCFSTIWGISRMKLSRSYLYLCVFPIVLFTFTVSGLSISLLFVTIVFLTLVLLLPQLCRRILLWLTLVLVATLAFTFFFPEIANKIEPPSLARLISESGSDVDRLQHIALLLIAPFLVIGVIALVRVIIRVFVRTHTHSGEFAWRAIISVFLAFVVLLNTGFLWQLTGNYSSVPVLNQTWVKEQGNVNQKADLYNAITMEQDVYSAEWLRVHIVPSSKIYATFDDDYVHPLTSYGLIPDEKVVPMITTLEKIPEDSYVYLQYLNVVEGIGTIWDRTLGVGAERHVRFDIAETTFLWEVKNKLYSNGGSEIYR